jgi:hypothetical protein
VKQNGAKVEYKANLNPMRYFQELERWLDVIFADLADNKMSYDEPSNPLP